MIAFMLPVAVAVDDNGGGDAREHAQRLVLATAAHVRHQAVCEQRRVRAHGQRVKDNSSR